MSFNDVILFASSQYGSFNGVTVFDVVQRHSCNDAILFAATQLSLDDVADDDEHDRRRSAVHAAGAVPGQAGGRQESH